MFWFTSTSRIANRESIDVFGNATFGQAKSSVTIDSVWSWSFDQ